jgi:hypothetical protein
MEWIEIIIQEFRSSGVQEFRSQEFRSRNSLWLTCALGALEF